MQEKNVMQLLENVVEQQNEVLRQLQSQRQELDSQKAQIEAQRQDLDRQSRFRKDSWDRLAAIAPILSAFIIAAIGAYFTYTYNLQQLKVQEIQTIERFMPHLMGNEKSKRAAILAISSLGNAQIAAKVAAIYASEGTASALQAIAEKSENKDKQVVRDALAQTLDSLADKYKYENKFDDALETYKRALAIKEETVGKDSPELAENLDKLAQMYDLHGDHAAAAQTLKRASALKGRSDRPDSFMGGSDDNAFAHAATGGKEQPDSRKPPEPSKIVTDTTSNTKLPETEAVADKPVSKAPSSARQWNSQPSESSAHASLQNHVADDARSEIQ